MIMTKAQLKDEELMNVNGGDYGDADKDNSDKKPMYNIGTYVQVYNNVFGHFSLFENTTTAYVRESRFDHNAGHWNYLVEFTHNHWYDRSGSEWINASEIQK